MTTVRIVCAAPQKLLGKLNESGIALYNIKNLDELTVVLSVRNCDYSHLRSMVYGAGCGVEIIDNKGLKVFAKILSARPVLLVGCFIWVCLLLYLPSRVLFVDVRGNHIVPDNMIIEEAEICGVTFGAARRGIRNEQIKNTLISKIPQLQWVGVNTYGCVAVISVEEKTDQEGRLQQSGVSSIVACHDGIISEITVERGNPTCAVGQAVTKGQILISGFTDCGLSVKAERASGSVYASTIREINAIAPAVSVKRTQQREIAYRYSLKIGKNIINLYKDSGISDTTCAKIYTDYALTLPGGFVLPVSLTRAMYISYECYDDGSGESADNGWMAARAEDYLTEHTVDATLLNRDCSYTEVGGTVYFKGRYLCREMIGRERYEEL